MKPFFSKSITVIQKKNWNLGIYFLGSVGNGFAMAIIGAAFRK
jgi:hypothetical protein